MESKEKTSKKTDTKKPVSKTNKKVETKKPVAKTTNKVETKKEVSKTNKKVETKKPVSKTTKKVETKTTTAKKAVSKDASKDAKKVLTDKPKNLEVKTKTAKEEIKVEEKSVVKTIEEDKDKFLTQRTWIITAICGILVLMAIILININNKNQIEENDYYLYSKDNSLILWDQKTNKKATLTSNYIVNSKESTVNYPSKTLYYIEEDKVYFIDDVNKNSFDLYKIDLEKAFINPEEKVLIEADVTDYRVVKENVYYIKNKELIYYSLDKKTKITEDVESFDITKTGNKIFYTNSESTLSEFNATTLKSKVIAENVKGTYYVVDEEVVYLVENDKKLTSLYNASGLVADNLTNYIKTDESIVYFQIDEDKLKEYEPGMKALEENKITLDEFKALMNNKETVLFYFGKPSCSYCAEMDKVFESISKTQKFSYVYINSTANESDVVYEMLDLLKIEASEFGTPTLAVTKNGKVINKNIGYLDEEAANKFLKESGVFASKFKYENPTRTNYSPDLLFLVSNTYIYNTKAKKFADGILYAGDVSKIEKANYQLSFVLPEDFDYINTTADDLYYNLKLVLTRTNSGKTIKTDITYTDLQFLSYDSYLNNIYYQTDDKITRNTFALSDNLKEKDAFDSICSMSSSPYATYLVVDCDSEYKGNLFKITRGSSKKVAEQVVQAYSVGNSLFYLKNINSSYVIYNGEGKELDKDLYLPIEFDDDFFYIKQNITDEEKKESTYDLYYATDDKAIKIDDNIDINLSIVPIG